MIVVEGGRIARVADARGKATYDLTGLTVMPGLIDTPVHPGWHFNKEGRPEQGEETPEQSALYASGRPLMAICAT
jgi:imidazolonepropionase-like amidohydrolase